MGIIGAGISGLGAARELKKLGHEAVVFEETREVGGRLATEEIGHYIFDSGPSSIAPRGLSLEEVMLHELDTSELEKVALPICIHSGLRIFGDSPMRNRIERYAYRRGNQTLANLLSEGIEFRFGSRVEALGRSNGRFLCMDEEFDGLIMTPPAPIAKTLLLSAGEGRSLANVSYRSCLSVMLGFDRAFTNEHCHGVLDPEQRHPLTWLSIESAKCGGRAPEGHTAFVAQLSSEFSRRAFETEDEKIVAATLDYLGRLYGQGWDAPTAWKVVRWRYSHPETTSLFESANRPGEKVVVAGDGVMGARVEFAYESGVRAAKMLAETL